MKTGKKRRTESIIELISRALVTAVRASCMFCESMRADKRDRSLIWLIKFMLLVTEPATQSIESESHMRPQQVWDVEESRDSGEIHHMEVDISSRNLIGEIPLTWRFFYNWVTMANLPDYFFLPPLFGVAKCKR